MSLASLRNISWHAAAVIALRSTFLLILLYSVDALVEIGTPISLIFGLGTIGIILATLFRDSALTSRGFILLIAIVVTGYLFTTRLAQELYPLISGENLSPFMVEEHLTLGFIALILTLGSTWAFWRCRHTITIEILVFSSFFVYLLSGHRNYRLDSPQFLNSLAWILGTDPQTVLIGSGSFILAATLIYLIATELPIRGTTEEQPRRNFLSTSIALGMLLLLLLAVGKFIYGRYDLAKGLTTNGVGEASEAGSSPLGFHSALGSTNQPAALVRLEGDYAKNPFSPMLYMRESALSTFNGHELVIADRTFDTDVSNTHPLEPYFGMEDSGLLGRVPINQSVYLLSDQKTAFAVDYPITIKQLKNPDPSKFRGAYRAYSLAPTYSLQEIEYDDVGDPRWSEAIRKHYLAPHPDKRYENLALDVALEAQTPIAKAFALTHYLSKISIYTLRPMHDIKPDEDPVAPFLFGDHRGYCVHFSHALVYMFRAIGIPARIGTGYLTDLSQSKDGHILLRMSDRHAWAEVYVTSRGWIPFDPQPEQVESSAENEVDMKLLEDLMGALEPGEEILPKDVLKDEPNVTEPISFPLPGKREVLVVLFCIISLFILLKLWLRFGWLLARTPQERLRRSYIALASRLCDIGLERSAGETRNEYQERICKVLNLSKLSTGSLFIRSIYSPKLELTREQIDSVRISDLQELTKLKWWQKALSFINPVSLLPRSGGAGW